MAVAVADLFSASLDHTRLENGEARRNPVSLPCTKGLPSRLSNGLLAYGEDSVYLQGDASDAATTGHKLKG